MPKNTNESKTKKPVKAYKFKNYFKSEKQLDTITYKSDPADILAAYSRLIYIYAKNHVRDGVVDLEDLMAEARVGICEAILDFKRGGGKKKNYTFNQACLYKIRSSVYQYCLRSINQLKTPYYIQRGCSHVGQIFKYMQNQKVAECLLGREGPATDQNIIDFIYNEKERLPLKPKKFIKAQINKKVTREEFNQIYTGILNHQLGSKHSYIKNNLSEVGKVLHIKEKIWYSIHSNDMSYPRVLDLIMLARQTQTSLDPTMYGYGEESIENKVVTRQIFDYGKSLCGEKEFSILIANKCYDLNYEEIAIKFNVKKNAITEIVKDCIYKLRKDEVFQDWFKELI